MPIVRFRRTKSEGLITNSWIINNVTGVRSKLRFRNDRALMELPLGVDLTLGCEMNGKVGDTLKIERKIEGIDDDYKLLLEAEIPDDGSRVDVGVRVTYLAVVDFTLEGGDE